MTQAYGDEYDLVAADDGRLIPGRVRRLAGAAVFLAMVGTMGLWAYRLGTRDAAEVPIIRAMEGPARIQPDDPGGLRTAHQGLEVNSVLAGKPAEAGAQQPAPRQAAPAALAEEDGPQGELVIAAPPMLAADALAAGEDLPMPPADDADGPEVALIEAPTAVAAADPANSAAVLDEALQPDPAAQAAPAVAAGPAPMRRPANLVLARAAAPEAAPTAAVAKPAEAAKPAAKPAEAAKPAAKPAARETASAKAGSRMVQLGAFDSEALARQAWNILAQTNRDLLASKSLYVERSTANSRVFYRLRVAGFGDQAETQKMCEALRARNVDCIPVTLN